MDSAGEELVGRWLPHGRQPPHPTPSFRRKPESIPSPRPAAPLVFPANAGGGGRRFGFGSRVGMRA